MDANLAPYTKEARESGRPVVLVTHTATNVEVPSYGAFKPIADYAAAVERGEAAMASGRFHAVRIVRPTGEVMVRVPGLDGVYVQDM